MKKIIWGRKFFHVLFIEQKPTEPPTVYQSLLESYHMFDCLLCVCIRPDVTWYGALR